MSKYFFSKLLSIPIFLLYQIFIITAIIKTSNANNAQYYNIESFFQNKFEICGDKYLSKTESGEIFLSVNLGFDWLQFTNFPKIKKIKIFENSKSDLKGNQNLILDANLNSFYYQKFDKNEKIDNFFKFSSKEEHIAFITETGKIIFSKNCGMDLLDKADNTDFTNYRILDEKIIVKDYIFHPYDQEKGLIIAYDTEGNIFETYSENQLNLRENEVYLTENFGGSVKKISNLNNQGLKKFYEFDWFPINYLLPFNSSDKPKDYLIGSFFDTKNLSIKNLFAFFSENDSDKYTFNTYELQNQIKSILKDYKINVALEYNSSNNTIEKKKEDGLEFKINSMKILPGSISNLNHGENYKTFKNDQTFIIAVNLQISDFNQKSKQLNDMYESYYKNNIFDFNFSESNRLNKNFQINNFMKKNSFLNKNTFGEFKFFFKTFFDQSKKNFKLEKINFLIEEKINFSFPEKYESITKLDENENFVFYLAKKDKICTGDLFVSEKYRNIWKLSAENLVLSQHAFKETSSQSIYVADFTQISKKENFYFINKYDSKNSLLNSKEISEDDNDCGIFFKKYKQEIQTFASYDGAKSWEIITNETSDRINLHLYSSLIYYNISPIESSVFGNIIANGSRSTHLFFPTIHELTKKFISENIEIDTFYSNDFGEKFKKIKEKIHTFTFANYGNLIIIVECNKPTNEISVSLDQGKSFIEYKIKGSAIMISNFLNYENNKIISKKMKNIHFLNKNKLQNQTVSSKINFLNEYFSIFTKSNLRSHNWKNPSEGISPDLNFEDIDKVIKELMPEKTNLNDIPFDNDTIIGIQAYKVDINQNQVIDVDKIVPMEFTNKSKKIFFNIDIQELLQNKKNLFSSNGMDITLVPKFLYSAESFIKIQKSAIPNKYFLQKQSEKAFFDLDDVKDLINIFITRSSFNSYLQQCNQDDFEVSNFKNSTFFLGFSEIFYKKKIGKVCLIDNFVIYQKKLTFAKNFLKTLLSLQIPESLFEKGGKGLFNPNIKEKLSFFISKKKTFVEEQQNYLSEILSTENFSIEKRAICNCELLRDFECDENLSNTNKFSNVAQITNNNIYQTCTNFIKNFHDSKDEQSLLENLNEFEMYISSANHCVPHEKHIKILSLDKSIKNLIKQDEKFYNVLHNIVSNPITERGSGFIIYSFICIIFILIIYMGYLVFKSFISNYFSNKKRRAEDEFEDEISLKNKGKINKIKELDSLY